MGVTLGQTAANFLCLSLAQVCKAEERSRAGWGRGRGEEGEVVCSRLVWPALLLISGANKRFHSLTHRKDPQSRWDQTVPAGHNLPGSYLPREGGGWRAGAGQRMTNRGNMSRQRQWENAPQTGVEGGTRRQEPDPCDLKLLILCYHNIPVPQRVRRKWDRWD